MALPSGDWPAPGAGRLLLLASATGTGPLRSVLAALPAGTVTVIYRTADPALRQELHTDADARGARAYYLPDGGMAAPGPLSPPGVRDLIPVLSRRAAFLRPAAAAAALTASGIPPAQDQPHRALTLPATRQDQPVRRRPRRGPRAELRRVAARLRLPRC